MESRLRMQRKINRCIGAPSFANHPQPVRSPHLQILPSSSPSRVPIRPRLRKRRCAGSRLKNASPRDRSGCERACNVSGSERTHREDKARGKPMQSSSWAEQHSQALREYLAKGLSFSQIAEALNARFNTAYSRNATIGRARRLGLSAPERPKRPAPLKSPTKPARPRIKKVDARASTVSRPKAAGPAEALKLRCVGIVPRHLSLIDLKPGDCRYPYGGDQDGEAITFCGHPRREGSSYCVAHFHLTSGPGTAAERSAGKVLLRLVEAA
jgi:GcrA cell cycle regulator